MKNLSPLFLIIFFCLLLVNSPGYAQEGLYINSTTTNKKVVSKGESEAGKNSRLAELITAHKASNKVLSLKDLQRYYGSDSKDWIGITEYASRTDTSATSEGPNKSKSPATTAFIGGAIGAIAGLLLYEIAGHIDIGLCNEGDPGCTSTRTGPNRLETILIFGGIGAVVGFFVGVF